MVSLHRYDKMAVIGSRSETRAALQDNLGKPYLPGSVRLRCGADQFAPMLQNTQPANLHGQCQIAQYHEDVTLILHVPQQT